MGVLTSGLRALRTGSNAYNEEVDTIQRQQANNYALEQGAAGIDSMRRQELYRRGLGAALRNQPLPGLNDPGAYPSAEPGDFSYSEPGPAVTVGGETPVSGNAQFRGSLGVRGAPRSGRVQSPINAPDPTRASDFADSYGEWQLTPALQARLRNAEHAGLIRVNRIVTHGGTTLYRITRLTPERAPAAASGPRNFRNRPLPPAVQQPATPQAETAASTPAQPASASRGLRNNNPLNIIASEWTRSQPGYVGSEGDYAGVGFAQFETPEQGRAAADTLLQSYSRRGLSTVSAIINEWSNPTHSEDRNANYIRTVASALGVSPNARLNMNDANTRSRLLAAMEQVESPGAGDASPAGVRTGQTTNASATEENNQLGIGWGQVRGFNEQQANAAMQQVNAMRADRQTQYRAMLNAGMTVEALQLRHETTTEMLAEAERIAASAIDRFELDGNAEQLGRTLSTVAGQNIAIQQGRDTSGNTRSFRLSVWDGQRWVTRGNELGYREFSSMLRTMFNTSLRAQQASSQAEFQQRVFLEQLQTQREMGIEQLRQFGESARGREANQVRIVVAEMEREGARRVQLMQSPDGESVVMVYEGADGNFVARRLGMTQMRRPNSAGRNQTEDVFTSTPAIPNE